MPMPGEDHGHMPRFRAEIGPYFAFGAGARCLGDRGAATSRIIRRRRTSEWQRLVFAGIGIGLEGAIGISSDGLIELGVGKNFASGQHEPGCTDCGTDDSGSLPARVPTRTPYVSLSCALLADPGRLDCDGADPDRRDFNLYKAMAIISANGGLLGLQPILLTPIGRFSSCSGVSST